MLSSVPTIEAETCAYPTWQCKGIHTVQLTPNNQNHSGTQGWKHCWVSQCRCMNYITPPGRNYQTSVSFIFYLGHKGLLSKSINNLKMYFQYCNPFNIFKIISSKAGQRWIKIQLVQQGLADLLSTCGHYFSKEVAWTTDFSQTGLMETFSWSAAATNGQQPLISVFCQRRAPAGRIQCLSEEDSPIHPNCVDGGMSFRSAHSIYVIEIHPISPGYHHRWK